MVLEVFLIACVMMLPIVTGAYTFTKAGRYARKMDKFPNDPLEVIVLVGALSCIVASGAFLYYLGVS